MQPDTSTDLPRVLHRILRFTDTLPGNTVATLDKDNNILLIDRAKFDQLPKHQKEQVYVATGDVILE